MNKQREILEKNKYLYVKNMISPDQCMFLREGIEREISKGNYRLDALCPLSQAVGHSAAIESVFPFLRIKLNNILQMELLPTYTYCRVYSRNETMAAHTDRPACEYSITMTIDYPREKAPWYIFFGDHFYPDSRVVTKKQDPIAVSINRGDAVVYKGCEIDHWRESNPNPWQIQIFYHFVDANGPYKDFIYDRRNHYEFDQQVLEEFMRRGN